MNLRRKLEPDPRHPPPDHVYGVGYKFVPDDDPGSMASGAQ